MSYIDKLLLADEKIIYRTKKHIIIFLTPTILTILLFLFYKNIYIGTLFGSTVNEIMLLPAVAVLIVWLNILLNYVTSDFIVTTKRVIMKEGFFFRHMNETQLRTISNVTVNQTLAGQLLNYGTICINTFGGDNDPFSTITSPNAFQKYLQMQLSK